MPAARTMGTYLLTPAHAEAIQRLASHPDLARFPEIAELASGPGVQAFIARQLEQRAEGTGHALVIMDGGEVRGLCRLQGIYQADAPKLEFWIGRPYWGKGYASFAVRMLLEFAFQNLQLERVSATAPPGHAGCRRVLEKNGLQPSSTRAEPGHPVYVITRRHWQVLRDQAALAGLHALLKPILEQELAAGNEVAEVESDWPDPGSVFVRLRHSFRNSPLPPPAGVVYSEPNNPHWWKADFSAGSPRHVLAG